ncbi:hypothetical protein OIO90_004977 [Microbotryomycetes sp. JL221]|nr:hypothetical protein OIO90_004977 [Microbotryomycetes sp. JL221]
MTYAVQVFQTKGNKQTLILPRSPVIKQRRQRYLIRLNQFIKQFQFDQVLVCTSVDMAMRVDDAIRQTTPFRHWFLNDNNDNTELQNRLKQVCPCYARQSESDLLPLFPHGGLTRSLLESLNQQQDQNFPISALIVYTSEGDNTLLSAQTAHVLNFVLILTNDLSRYVKFDQLDDNDDDQLQIEKQQDSKTVLGWNKPNSWLMGLTGNPLTRTVVNDMFG